MNKHGEISVKYLNFQHAISLYMGSVLGGGILILPSITVAIAGPAAIISWILVTLFCIPIAIMFSKLSSTFPNQGGISIYAREAFGQHIGAITGWLYFFILPCGQPAVMLTGINYLNFIFGFSREVTLLLAWGILSFAAVLSLLGKRMTAQIQLSIVTGIILIMVGVIVAGAGSMQFGNFSPFIPNGINSIIQAMAIIIWSYIGIENLSFIAGDFENPAKDITKALIAGTLLTGLLYVGVCWTTIGILTPQQWEGVNAPFAFIANQIYGPSSAFLVVGMGLFIVVASALAIMWGGSNLCAALANQQALPAQLLKKHNNINYAAILFLWGLYTIAFLIIYQFDISITQLASCVGASTLLTYAICSIAYLRLIKDGAFYAVCTLIFSVGLLPFFGWTLLYPLITIVLYVVYVVLTNHLKRSTVKFLAFLL